MLFSFLLVVYGMVLSLLIVDLTFDSVPDSRVACLFFRILLTSPAFVGLTIALSVLTFLSELYLSLSSDGRASTGAKLVLIQCGMILSYTFLCLPQYALIMHTKLPDLARLRAGHGSMCVLAISAICVLLKAPLPP